MSVNTEDWTLINMVFSLFSLSLSLPSSTAGELGNAVQDAFVIAVEQQARERLQRLSALKRITPVDMSQLSIKVSANKTRTFDTKYEQPAECRTKYEQRQRRMAVAVVRLVALRHANRCWTPRMRSIHFHRMRNANAYFRLWSMYNYIRLDVPLWCNWCMLNQFVIGVERSRARDKHPNHHPCTRRSTMAPSNSFVNYAKYLSTCWLGRLCGARVFEEKTSQFSAESFRVKNNK